MAVLVIAMLFFRSLISADPLDCCPIINVVSSRYEMRENLHPMKLPPLKQSFTIAIFICLLTNCIAQVPAQRSASLLTVDPGKAFAAINGTTISLANSALRVQWTVADGRLKFMSCHDLFANQTMTVPSELFIIRLRDGHELRSSQMSLASGPEVNKLDANPNASRLSERLPGESISATLSDSSAHVTARWAAILRDGSNYLRQEITFSAVGNDVPVVEVQLIAWNLPHTRVVGTVAGSPVVANHVFAGFENPLSKCSVTNGTAICSLRRELPLVAGHEVKYSSVIGVTPEAQLRRGFLNYVERERAHPYRTFLHYNTWYDLGYFGRYDQAGVIDRVQTFGTELHQKRGVSLDSFLFDDGWDDPSHLWHFNPGFPNGLTAFAEAAAKYGIAPGIWLSPWGGYAKPHQERIKFGQQLGFETNRQGFELSGPRYYQYFHDVCLDMIRKYGVNQFKFDGTGNVNEVIPGSPFDSDFAAAISLIKDLRVAKPDLYVNLTTGTYPSPFWLLYADSIWRGGDDHSFAGVGSWRQKWITYRDADTYAHVVRAGPLYPLNSLMLHGLIFARYAKHLGDDPGNDFASEVHDYFGTGTQLQEMYITPSLLTQANWDVLAEAAKWSRDNSDVLRDTHWVGGDPAKLEVYGWASWSPAKAILVLRNPSDTAQNFSIDIRRAFELPPGAPADFQAHSPWQKDSATKSVTFSAGKPTTFSLAPFEVRTLEMIPTAH
jgi:hypothetical protein